MFLFKIPCKNPYLVRKTVRETSYVPACKEKEEAIATPRTEGIDRRIILRVRVGKHELRFLAGYADILLPPLYIYVCRIMHTTRECW